MTPLFLQNTLTRRKEEFVPADNKIARMYCCGPTVYNYAHIGNLRTYIFEDLLHRILMMHGWDVFHVMNITDVGHLTSDADAGKDKMETAAEREGKSPWEIAKFYEKAFFDDCDRLNIIRPRVTPRATEHIDGMIALIQELEAKGYTYTTSEGVYFDTARDADYGKLAGLNLSQQKEGARDAVNVDPDKRHPADFVLWFTNKPTHIMKWESPWGVGYPGWHIECSAMSMQYLGQTLDIHCGGIDHVPVHHTNEIAQSECATDTTFARFWLHGAFLNLNKSEGKGGKMSKSSGTFLTVQKLINDGFDPLAYRYFCLTAHYRSELTFSDDALAGASKALSKIYELKARTNNGTSEDITNDALEAARITIIDALNDDLNLPRAIAALHDAKSYRLWKEFDAILGLDIEGRSRDVIPAPGDDSELPEDVRALMAERDAARKAKEWAKSDTLRTEIESLGFIVGDSPAGTTVKAKLL